jgi:hypothetical protein
MRTNGETEKYRHRQTDVIKLSAILRRAQKVSDRDTNWFARFTPVSAMFAREAHGWCVFSQPIIQDELFSPRVLLPIKIMTDEFMI